MGKRRWPARHPGLVALGCALWVLGAIAAEVLASMYAVSPVPGWSVHVFPLAWPRAVRVVWWLGVAAAAGGVRWGLHAAGIPQRRLIIVASVLPFVIFAGGIADGAWWATWH